VASPPSELLSADRIATKQSIVGFKFRRAPNVHCRSDSESMDRSYDIPMDNEPGQE
jgi:hypothetical protein